MMSVSDYTAYLGKSVNFFLPCTLPTKPNLGDVYYPVNGLVTSVIIDLDPRKHRFSLDDDTQEFYFKDCVSLSY